jgi:uncharacterized protein YndB with AHSA1/START domain
MNWKARKRYQQKKGAFNMQNLKIEKVIARDPKDVFKSLKEGKLFMNCSADSNSIEIDFRVGGKYKLNFKNHKVSNWGEFLEIVPEKKIVFSWCQTFGPDQKPDTRVTIELVPEGAMTKLVLEHVGFKDKETCDSHYQGWSGGINDLANEMENGCIRLVRRYELPVEALYQKVTELKDLFGDTRVEIPNQKLALGEHVTIVFSQRDDKISALEVLQNNLLKESDRDSTRKHWDKVTTKLLEIVG